MEAATSSYSATGEFLQYIYSVVVASNHQKIKVFSSLIFPHSYFFLIPFYVAAASYCCYEKVRRRNARSLSIFILFQLHG